MDTNNLAKLALAGLLSAGLASAPAIAAEGDAPKKEGDPGKESAEKKYHEVHDCAGLNVCKGLGGCKVTEEKLAKLAEKAGVPLEKAGEAHECAGHNECKGLGGCKVTAEKFAKLKAAVEAKKAEADKNEAGKAE